jgi:hypothetical protein
VVAGMTALAQVIAYHKDSALTVPAKALNATDDGGWEVEIEAEERQTRPGEANYDVQRQSGSGLTQDQSVIIRRMRSLIFVVFCDGFALFAEPVSKSGRRRQPRAHSRRAGHARLLSGDDGGASLFG